MPATYNPRTNRFRSAAGRTLSPERIVSEVDKAIARAERRFRSLGNQLARRRISIVEFQIAMKEEIKLLHTVTSAVGQGGWQQMALSDWGRVGARLRQEYAYLNRFARAVEQGRVSDRQLKFRASLYAKNARVNFINDQIARERSRGESTQVRRVLHSKDGCNDCRQYTSFMAIDRMPAIGTLACRQFCRCTLEYR